MSCLSRAMEIMLVLARVTLPSQEPHLQTLGRAQAHAEL